MRILIVTAAVPFPPIGGGRMRTYQLTKSLVQHHDVTLVGFTYDEDISSPPFSLRVVGVPWQWPALYEEMHSGDAGTAARAYEMLDLHLDEPWLASFYDCASMEAEITRLNKEDFDCVLFEGTDMARFLPLVAPNTPAIVDFMDVHSQMALREADSAVGEHKVRADREVERIVSFEKQIAARCVRCLVCSDLEAQAVRTLLGVHHLTVVPNGVDTTYFLACQDTEREDYILFTGTMNYGPNSEAVTHFANNILPRIQQQIPACHFHIVGARPSESVQRLQSSTIIVHGRVEDMRRYFHEAAVVVVPLLRGGGTRLKILEAAACAKAIVTTSIGAEGLHFRAGAELVIADTAADFSSAVVQLLSNAGERQQLGLAARAAGLQYDWAAIGSRFCELIDSLNLGVQKLRTGSRRSEMTSQAIEE